MRFITVLETYGIIIIVKRNVMIMKALKVKLMGVMVCTVVLISSCSSNKSDGCGYWSTSEKSLDRDSRMDEAVITVYEKQHKVSD